MLDSSNIVFLATSPKLQLAACKCRSTYLSFCFSLHFHSLHPKNTKNINKMSSSSDISVFERTSLCRRFPWEPSRILLHRQICGGRGLRVTCRRNCFGKMRGKVFSFRFFWVCSSMEFGFEDDEVLADVSSLILKLARVTCRRSL